MWSVCMFTLGRPGCKDQSVHGLSDELGVRHGSCYLHCSLWGLGQNGGKDSLVEAVEPVEDRNPLLELTHMTNAHGFRTNDTHKHLNVLSCIDVHAENSI